ncbi:MULTISPECIES: hypothetical protein [unclassified Leifsonia]|uniref:hypothetical protein n=1 Tax=unclassified Leifsonia TaxID=2663824 RepID=UPI0008A7BA81|nr:MULTISPECIES: hypothetical protein [unclassified Leifsonia]SEH66798.1 hypothetical protein SAMN04515694_10284 [Leifsonia sp. CL154]SFL28524.1 hypothetical protein SAMN04515692_10285 [Leifsonia sp. CL147]
MSTPLNASPVLVRRSREALSTLAVQFLLGMGANLIGSPEENAGGARVVAGIILGLHALVGIGVIVVAVRVWLAARREGVAQTAALWAFIVIILTFLVGVGTMFTGSGWMSFLMALGFVVAAALYVVIGAGALRRQRSSVAS